MSAITLNFTMTEWQKLVSAGISDEIFRCIAARESLHRKNPVESVVAVADSDAEDYGENYAPLDSQPKPSISLDMPFQKLERGPFATLKTAEFAANHEITPEMIPSPTGQNGKITMTDVKKALPPKKRGRKPKAKPEGDLIDSLVSKPKKAKKVKDPNAPKRPDNSWFIYLREQRPLVKAANPDIKGAAAIVKMVSAIWHSLSTEAKAPYEAMAVADKERYASEKAAYDLTKAPQSKSPKAAKAKSPKAAKAKTAKAKADAKAKAKADAKAALARLQEQLAGMDASQEASQAEEYEEVVFDDLEDETDDEMDEELTRFEYPAGSGSYYLRADDNMVFENEDGPSIGEWDAEDQVVIFDD